MTEPDRAGWTKSSIVDRKRGSGARLRRAKPADETAVTALSAQFVAEDLLLARSPEQISSRMGEFLLAVAGDAVVGCVGTTSSGHELLIYNLCVAPIAQHRGIGGQLVEAVARSGEWRGATTLYAVSRYSGPWFLRHGFTVPVAGRTPLVLAPHLVSGRGSTVYRRALRPIGPQRSETDST
jgi:N-acetylglutamate synthase-like GNAT family acetyltransferase